MIPTVSSPWQWINVPPRDVVIVVNYTVTDGKSNWLEGMILMCLYLMLAVVFWYYPGQWRRAFSAPPVAYFRVFVRRRRCQFVSVLIRSCPNSPASKTRIPFSNSIRPDTAAFDLEIYSLSPTMSSSSLTRNTPHPSDTCPKLHHRSNINRPLIVNHLYSIIGLSLNSPSPPRSPTGDFAAVACEGKVSGWGRHTRALLPSLHHGAPPNRAPLHLRLTPTGRHLAHGPAFFNLYLRYLAYVYHDGSPWLAKVMVLRLLPVPQTLCIQRLYIAFRTLHVFRFFDRIRSRKFTFVSNGARFVLGFEVLNFPVANVDGSAMRPSDEDGEGSRSDSH